MKTRRHKKVASTLYASERTAVMAAVTFFVAAFSLYMYFLSASIVNVVMRQEIDGEIRNTSARIAELETRYILAKGRVTPETAHARGFSSAAEKTFVSKKNENVVLSRNDES